MMRPIWNGSLSFGLVNIPVRLYSASKERALKFKMLSKHDLCPISYKKVCREDNKLVEWKDVVKGYEYEKDEYVILDEKDFKRANAKKTETVEIESFADIEEIEPKLFERPLYVEPMKKATKAYALLRDALKETKKVGIARYVLRDKELVGALYPDGDILILDQLRYLDELRPPEDLSLPGKPKYTKREKQLATNLIRELSEEFDPKKYKDTYADDLRAIIRDKARGKKKKRPKGGRAPIPTDMKDVLKALRESLGEQKTLVRK